ncbi:hypothetical protein [Eubacterium pyruvativorans]|uniref:hypothetical protein n=1 Tax=Eubacterium pyruvativorans TaxID=155865 RepID=UPI003F8BCCF7
MTMVKSSKKALAVLLAVACLITFMPAMASQSFAAKKLTVKPAKKTIYVKKSVTLKANQKVKWSASKASLKVVKLTSKKAKSVKVTGKKAGKAVVTAKVGKQTKKVTITVKKAPVKKTAVTAVALSADNAKDPAKEVLVGTKLRAAATPENATVTYQWKADGTAIAGATGSTFTVTTAEIGKAITVEATGTGNFEKTAVSAATAKVAAITVDNFYIDGTPAVDETLKVKAQATKDNALADLSYDVDQLATVEWHRVTTSATNGNKSDVVVGTGASYKIVAADKDSKLYAVVTPNKDVKVATTINGVNGTPTTTVTAKDGKYTLPATNPVTANNIVTKVVMKAEGKELAANTEVKAGTALSTEVTPAAAASALDYQWYKNGYKIDGATSSTYTPSEAGTYTVKVTIKKDNLVYSLGQDVNTEAKVGSAVVPKTYKEFTGVKFVNVTATKEKRTTNEAGDTYGIEIPGLTFNTDYTVSWKKVKTDNYGKVTTPDEIGTSQTYTGNGLNAGDKIYAVVTGKDTSSYKGYQSTTATITIDKAAAVENAGALGVTSGKLVTFTPSPALTTGQTVVWQKGSVSNIGLDTVWADTSATGFTYELSTAETTGSFKLRAVVKNADGTVAGYSNDTVTVTNGTAAVDVKAGK